MLHVQHPVGIGVQLIVHPHGRFIAGLVEHQTDVQELAFFHVRHIVAGAPPALGAGVRRIGVQAASGRIEQLPAARYRVADIIDGGGQGDAGGAGRPIVGGIANVGQADHHRQSGGRFPLLEIEGQRVAVAEGFGKLYENAGAVDIVLENQLPVLDTDGGLVGRGGIGVAQGIALKIVGKYRRAFCRGPKAGQRHGRQNRQRRAKGKNLLFHNESPFSNIPHPNRCDRPGI